MIKASIRICTLSILTFVLITGGALTEVHAHSPVKPSAQHTLQLNGKFTEASAVYQEGQYIIRWQANQDLGAAKVYWSTSPVNIEKTGQVIAHTYSRFHGITVKDPAPGQRVYFLIKGGNGATKVTAERAVKLEGIVNFRDLGGYETTDGRHVKWGTLFRSGELAGLTDQGKQQIQQLGLKTIVDFRTDSEVAAKPDPQITGAAPIRLPAFKEQANSSNGADLNSLIAKGDFSVLGKPGEMLIKTNKDLIKSPDAYVKMMKLLGDPKNASLVQHCTAGKDRAGLGSAIILLTLGVDEDTVMQDYMLSNVYRAEANQKTMDMMSKVIQDKEALKSFQALMEVRESYLQAALDTIKQEYGSIDGFIEQGLGITKEQRSKLQSMYLE